MQLYAWQSKRHCNVFWIAKPRVGRRSASRLYAEIGGNIILSFAQYYISSYFSPRLLSFIFSKSLILKI